MRTLLCALALVCSTAAVSHAAAATRPTIRLDDETTPVLLRGSGFQPREHVKIVIATGTTRLVRRTIATQRGSFAIRFPDASANDCTGFSVTALGNHGTRATLKRAPGQCAQP